MRLKARIYLATTDASSNSGTQFIEETVSSQNKVYAGIDAIVDNLDAVGEFLREMRYTGTTVKKKKEEGREALDDTGLCVTNDASPRAVVNNSALLI